MISDRSKDDLYSRMSIRAVDDALRPQNSQLADLMLYGGIDAVDHDPELAYDAIVAIDKTFFVLAFCQAELSYFKRRETLCQQDSETFPPFAGQASPERNRLLKRNNQSPTSIGPTARTHPVAP